MRNSAYTTNDAPMIVARIDEDLGRVRDRVRGADPGLRSLVLTGGFARGEGTVHQGRPQNDYDLIAIRRPTRRVDYASLEAQLTDELGLHIDLAPVASWRLRRVSRSIFWYETALRGRVLWGQDLLDRIPIRTPESIEPREGIRLLANRAAGLLLATDPAEDHLLRIQACKGLLAAMDAHLLATGRFAPSQTERWRAFGRLRANGHGPPEPEGSMAWLDWAYAFKTQPDAAPGVNAWEAWHAARSAILAAVPTALRHAGAPSLEACERRDGLVDRAVYFLRARRIQGARPWARHPTGRVRTATLRLLEEADQGKVRPEDARARLGALADGIDDPLRWLRTLRGATLQ